MDEIELIWRRVMDDQSMEHAWVQIRSDGATLSGLVLIAQEGAPLRVEYAVICDALWRTRSVTVSQTFDGSRRALRLEHDGLGNWMRDGIAIPALDGCTDVDLGVSPSTNMLPINRLRLAIGQREIIKAAWVRFPALNVVQADQAYQRTSEMAYRYSGIDSGFQAMVAVDGHGLPIDYEGVWRRIAARRAPGTSPSAWPTAPDAFAQVLFAPGPHPDLGERADDVAWLAGGWTAEVDEYQSDGSVLQGQGEWWFNWVLEGRALQDVWVVPVRSQRTCSSMSAPVGNRYGSTLRWYDPKEALWRINWVNPIGNAHNHLSGRRHGDRIVLAGHVDSNKIRWSFNDIRADSFRWLGETCIGPDVWRTDAEFRLRRRF